MKKSIVSVVLVLNSFFLFAQTNDEKTIKEIYKSALTNSKCYSWLDYLSNKIGARLSGSASAEKAVQYTKAQLETLGLDRVYLQEVMVPKWVRGEKETAYIQDKKTKINVPICALGGSIATPKNGLTAEVIEVQSIKELTDLGNKIKGKIVFFNRPMEPENIETFKSYGGCVDQRYAGAKEASKFGAVGTIVRSMNLRLDDFPHTGVQSYGDISKSEYIPTAAISTNGAELLSKTLKNNPNLKFYFKQSCKQMEDVLSYNVIGEIKGSENPENIMVVGGHLDSWDLADGSHDDGAGVVQSMEVVNIFKKIGYKPKNTIRVVLFMNEENGGRGGDKYEELAQANKENHIFALESDSGGFSPRGFSFESDDVNFNKILTWKNLFEPYLIHSFVKGHSGSDIDPLTSKTLVKAGLKPDSQRYFDYHHAGNDTFDAINKRELELGAATMASLMYLIDQNGIEKSKENQ
ncbi:M28 family peptidase [Flavobacterium gawalongense]|uniref:Carboxypeptidase Q n=1 Tax=Flavobacterium gawalongense TaxID=2594432 RepID=A0A553BSS9_9FLAO|nr:M28 family peptidase [Flavobacterium gawalongense]TRX03675.1 M20/M25/M40 family metallo-hydrolase [Flavobacterium gawalongense]TRX08822.1 M20/M25/M40 family metallo-hydrolase [Flavobacterium gawalongense]TRX11299.1 M20/M25/M40 family metallo-hydrolase [Flavobacterium gawalongense]TRX12240.1 M20/M25/M40 family metallo-hydrolase [Flavobacterium gawalongense]TRX30221.1 M20/M25/M40 family metallo-hydrolase [Flavobacterium gawalongense]